MKILKIAFVLIFMIAGTLAYQSITNDHVDSSAYASILLTRELEKKCRFLSAEERVKFFGVVSRIRKNAPKKLSELEISAANDFVLKEQKEADWALCNDQERSLVNKIANGLAKYAID